MSAILNKRLILLILKRILAISVFCFSGNALSTAYNMIPIPKYSENVERSNKIATTLHQQKTALNLNAGKLQELTDELFEGIYGENLLKVKDAIKRGADVNKASLEIGVECLPLNSACTSAHSLSIVKCLINHGAKPNEEDAFNTPLIAACSSGSLPIVKFLIEHGAIVNKTYSRNHRCPLSYCFFKPDFKPEIVEYLLANGAEVNIRDIDGVTPLTHAKKTQKTIADNITKSYWREWYAVRKIDPLALLQSTIELLIKNGAHE